MRRLISIIAIPALAVGAAVIETPAAAQADSTRTLWVAHYRSACPEGPEQGCYLIKGDLYREWSPWPGEIEGLDYEPGFAYEIRVIEKRADGAAAPPAAPRLELLEVLSKIEAFERPEYAAPEPAVRQPPPAPPGAASAVVPRDPRSTDDSIFKGYLTIGDGQEARAFRLCGDQQSIWIEDETGELWAIYRTVSGRPNRPVFMAVRGRLIPPPRSGFGAHYGRQLTVTQLLHAAIDGKGCDAE